MTQEIYDYLYEELYGVPSCLTCQYSYTKRTPCEKCDGYSKYKFHQGHKADLQRVAKDIVKIVKKNIK